MAIYETPLGSRPQIDPLKKKLRPDADVAGYTAPLARPQGTQIGHLTLQPGSGADTAAKAIGGFFGGLKEKQAQFHANQPQVGVIPFGAPSAAPSPAAPLAPKPRIITPSNPASMTITPPSAAMIPARNPASPAQSGGSGAAGGVPAPSTIGPLTGGGAGSAQPGFHSVASGVNAQGNNIYDNASIARLTERMAAPGGGVPAQSFGGLPLPSAPAASMPAIAPTQAPAVAIPRPARADAFNVRQADQNTGKIAGTLEDAAFRTGLRANRGSRSAADAQASILQTLAQLGGQRLGVAAGIAGGDRDATAGNDRTALTEGGANQRTALADTGETARTGMKAASDERVAQLGTLAELNRPTQVTDAGGHLLRVTGTSSAPIQGADGQPVRLPLEGAITPALALASLSQQLEAETQSIQPDQARMGALRQQIDALMRPAANSAPRPATHSATNTKTGERVRYNPTTQQWDPIPAG